MAQFHDSPCQLVSMGGSQSPSSLLKTSSLPVNIVLHPSSASTGPSLTSSLCDCTIHPVASSANPIAAISSPSRLQRRLHYWDAACHGSSPRRPALVRTQSCVTPAVAVELASEHLSSLTSSPSCRRTLSCPQWPSCAEPAAPAARIRMAREDLAAARAASATASRHAECVGAPRGDESVFHWAARTRILRAQAALAD